MRGPDKSAVIHSAPTAARSMAVEALRFLAADETRLERFLAVTGLGPHNLRRAAADPGFSSPSSTILRPTTRLLVAFAAEAGPAGGRAAGATA